MKTIAIFFIIIFCGYSCSDDEAPIHKVGWEIMDSHTYNTLSDVEFFDDDFGIISGNWGTLLKTEDGGKFWQPLRVGIESSFTKVFILNENEFYFSSSTLYKGHNRGNSFSILGDFINYGGFIFDIHFFDSNSGLVARNDEILKTSDGCRSWYSVCDKTGYAQKMQLVSNSIGFIAGGLTTFDYNGIDWYSSGKLLKTINGGNSWYDIDIPIIRNSEITAMNFINEDTGFITNHNQEFYITQDGGTTWDLTCDSLPSRLRGMVFLSKDEGYGIGYRSIYKTTDGGMNWIMEYTDSTMTFISIAKTPNDKIFVVGCDGIILKRE